MITAFLQNAWSPMYAGGTWPRDLWLRALHRSRSGQRIAILTDIVGTDGVWFDNTTPIVGASPSSIVPPDFDHIARVIGQTSPSALIAMGKQAAVSLMPFIDNRPLLIVPHPAYRVLTSALYEQAGHLLRDGFSGVVELRQAKGTIQTLRSAANSGRLA